MGAHIFLCREYVQIMHRACGSEVLAYEQGPTGNRDVSLRGEWKPCVWRIEQAPTSSLSCPLHRNTNNIVFALPPPPALRPLGSHPSWTCQAPQPSLYSPQYHPPQQARLSVISATWHFFRSPPQLYIFSIAPPPPPARFSAEYRHFW
jgi:hypothetical protein